MRSELFALHPMAWSHAQIILDQEVEMIKSGASAELRRAFLLHECARFIQRSEIMLVDALDSVLSDLDRDGVLRGVDEMRHRVAAFGFHGTLRSMRNQQRRLGITAAGLDAVTVHCAITVLENDELFRAALHRMLIPIAQDVLASAEFDATTIDLTHIYEQRLLRSEQDRQATIMLTDAVRQLDLDAFKADRTMIRDIAYVRGRILDVDCADILTVLVRTFGRSAISTFLRDTRTVQAEIYSHVLTTLINERAAELSAVPAFTQHDATDELTANAQPSVSAPSHAMTAQDDGRELMTLAEVMDFLRISRTTLYQLRRSGALDIRHVGSSVRVTRSSVLRYLDLKE